MNEPPPLPIIGEPFNLEGDVPTFKAVVVGFCRNCKHPHLILFDQENKAVGHIALTDDTVLRTLQAAARLTTKHLS
jgi:hypothetical protein